jgi:hypothetical protein
VDEPTPADWDGVCDQLQLIIDQIAARLGPGSAIEVALKRVLTVIILRDAYDKLVKEMPGQLAAANMPVLPRTCGETVQESPG